MTRRPAPARARSVGRAAGLLAGALLLGACATSVVADPANPVVTPVDTGSSPPSSSDPASADDVHPVLAAQATAADGSRFSIADFGGKTVFVETFATWCGNCRRQLGDTNAAAAEAGDDVVFLVLSIETELDPAELATYAADNGFDNVRFGVLDAQGLVDFNAQFGRSVLNAPSTPKFIVRADGSISELTTGFETSQEILGQLA